MQKRKKERKKKYNNIEKIEFYWFSSIIQSRRANVEARLCTVMEFNLQCVNFVDGYIN